jgi:hypothetical protein
MSSPAGGGRRLAAAVAGSAAMVLAAPFFGELRSAVRTAFPSQFTLIVGGLVGTAVAAAVVAALWRVRSHRWPRYAAMAVTLACAVAYSEWTGASDPAIRMVEYSHFVEYGVITFLFYRVWRHRGDGSALAVPAIAAFVAGVAAEGYQWFLPARVGELKDVWLNAVAIGCGLLFAVAAAPPPAFRFSWPPAARRLTARAVAVALLTLAAFVHAVHLGVEIRTPEAGAFVSRYTADELATFTADRAEAWRTAPPLVRPPRLSREDQFMTEGLQHVQARNKAWAAGDAFTAWRENLILERHFAIVLDTPSYVSKTGHRWPEAQRADAERQVQGTAQRPFVSAAYPYPVYVWPPAALWLATLVSAAALLALNNSIPD